MTSIIWIVCAIQVALAAICIAAFSAAARRARRDYFAAKAMQAFLSGHIAHFGHENHWPYSALTSEAYDVADAMLKAR